MSPDYEPMSEELCVRVLGSLDEYVSIDEYGVVLDGRFNIEQLEAILYRMNHPSPKL